MNFTATLPQSIITGTNNRAFMNDASFREACREADTPVTRRQASKFRRQKGKAYKTTFKQEVK